MPNSTKGSDQQSQANWRECLVSGIAAGIQPANDDVIDQISFLRDAVYTIDEASGAIRQFPKIDYLFWLARERPLHQLFGVVKARRMLITWLMVSLYLHDTLTKRNHANFIASRKLESSCNLLGRAYQIYENIPAAVWPEKPAIKAYVGYRGNGYLSIECPSTNSVLMAVAEGPDQLRQYTASNVLCDEAAFWTKWGGTFAAMKPTVQGGGHIDIVTTPDLGAEVETTLYDLDGEGRELHGMPRAGRPTQEPMTGIQAYETKSGVFRIELDFIADPAKRSKEYEVQAHSGLTEPQFQREFRRNWRVSSGQAIFGKEFNESIHVTPYDLEPVEGVPILRGLDFGLQPACAYAQLLPNGKLLVLDENVTWTGRGAPVTMSAEEMAEYAQRYSNTRFYDYDFDDWADPAGWQQSQVDKRSCVEIFSAHDFNPKAGPVSFVQRQLAMSTLLKRLIDGEPAIQISPRCRMIIDGLRTAYKYKQIGEGENVYFLSEPIKNAWSHITEALCYIVSGVYGVLPLADDDSRSDRKRRRSSKRAGALY